MIRRPRLMVTIMLSLAMALLGAGSAAPVAAAIHTGSYQQIEASQLVPANSEYGVVASCPTGKRAVAGGVFWSVAGAEIDRLLARDRWLSSNLPVGAGQTWYAAGRNYGVASTLNLTIECLSTDALGTYKVHSVTAPAGNTSSATAKCPAGYRAMTGGAAWRYPGNHWGVDDFDLGTFSISMPTSDGRGWTATGSRATSGSSARLHVTAMCLTDAMAGVPVHFGKTLTLHAVTTFEALVGCPPGYLTMDGGASITWTGGGAAQGAWITASVPALSATSLVCLREKSLQARHHGQGEGALPACLSDTSGVLGGRAAQSPSGACWTTALSESSEVVSSVRI